MDASMVPHVSVRSLAIILLYRAIESVSNIAQYTPKIADRAFFIHMCSSCKMIHSTGQTCGTF